MYRVFLSALLAAALGGCSLGTPAITTGFFDQGSTTASISPPQGNLGLGGGYGSSRSAAPSGGSATRLAKADDKAPAGSYEKAPHGILADRDYTRTALDPQKARDAINAYRRQHGLKPLQLNATLTTAAKEHSRDLAKWDRISHYGSDGSNPWDRVKRVGYRAKLAAENVGTGQVTFDEVMKGWKASPGHNKNLLLADAEHMGIALVQDPRTEFKSFWTLVLGSAM